jgi:ribosomal protein L19
MIMPSVTKQIEEKYKKHAVVDVRPGDSVRVHQKIREGKQRTYPDIRRTRY